MEISRENMKRHSQVVQGSVLHVLQRAVEPPEVKHERLFVVSVLGFFVNLIGIFAFQHGHSHGGGGGESHCGSLKRFGNMGLGTIRVFMQCPIFHIKWQCRLLSSYN